MGDLAPAWTRRATSPSIENTPIDYLDFASPESRASARKIGLDATNKWPPETKREWGRKIRMDQAVDRQGRRDVERPGTAGERQADLEETVRVIVSRTRREILVAPLSLIALTPKPRSQ